MRCPSYLSLIVIVILTLSTVLERGRDKDRDSGRGTQRDLRHHSDTESA